MRIRFFVPLLLLTAASSLFAQPKETVNVNVVEVPVSVIDRDGNPIRGLTAANFELYDAGQKRAISAFDKIDFSSRESVKAVSPMNPAARRTLLLLFDLTFSSPKSLLKAQQAARDFVAQNAQRRDLVAVGSIDVDRGFRFLTSFTTDRTVVASAIGDPRNFSAFDPLQIAGRPILDDSVQSTGSGTNSNARLSDEDLRDIQKTSSRSDDNYNRQRIEKQFTMLGGLAKTLRNLPGRKQVVLLSEGFDPRLIQGRGGKTSKDQILENEAASYGEVWKIDSESRFGSAEGMSSIDRMAQLFRRSNVVLHAVDIHGLRLQGDVQSGEKESSNEGLSLVAGPTGGTVFKNSNDLKSDFDRLMKQQEVVYVLAFQAPASSSPGKFHDLKVKLVDVPGGAHASYRPGYYETGGETPIERQLSNAQIIFNDIPVSDIHVAALAATFPTSSDYSQVPVILEINGDDLIASAKGNTATAEIFVYAFDEDGVVRDSLFQRMGLDLDKAGAKLKGSGIKYYGTLSLPPGTYAVKNLVRVAETDRKGYSRTDLIVPKPGEVAVSQPLFYEEPGKWFMVKGGSHDRTNAGYPFEINGETFIPTATVRIRNGEPRKFALFVYNAAPDDLTVETTPQTKLLTKLKGATGNVSKLVLQLDQAGAPALSVTVHRKGGGDATSSAPIAQ
jgi:VWFA-related protein